MFYRLRVYTGSHVLIRFLTSAQGKLLTNNCDIIELGCGTGVVGIVGTVDAFAENNMRSLLLTDGNPQAIQLTRSNIDYFFPNIDQHENITIIHDHALDSHQVSTSPDTSTTTIPLSTVTATSTSTSTKIKCTEYLWSRSAQVATSLCTYFNNNQPFDIVLGCELMYYRTDIELLLANVINLTSANTTGPSGQKGLFIHSHVFRGDFQQETLLKTIFLQYKWLTLFIPIHTFISPEELYQHPEWYAVIVLISGPGQYIQQLVSQYGNLGWTLFLSCKHARDANYLE